MLPKISTVLLFLAVTIHPAGAEIDFTPEVKEYTAEGFTHRELTFKHDKGTVTFGPPQKWLVRGDKAQLRLGPPDKNFVEAIIQAAPSAVSPSFDEQSLKALEQQVLREAPSGALSVQIVKRMENPVVVGSYRSFEFVLSYQTLGRPFQRSVLFLNCPDQQVTVQFTAPKPDFETFNGDLHRSMSSWQWINEPAAAAAGPMPAAK